MCGFCGIVNRHADPNIGDRVDRMSATLQHRGPDACGTFVDRNVGLGHRRLSVVDLSPTGAQPMTLNTDGITVAFNGEIYNFVELRAELGALGCVFQGRSDTEVILHAYRCWGLAGLSRLEGIFAFGLWDSRYQRMILVRDRLGVKPLFYALAGDELIFGSEIKAVLAAGGFGSEIDDQALAEYLWFGNTFEDRTFYRAIRALMPGQRLVFEAGRMRLEFWWRVEDWLADSKFQGNEADAADAVRLVVDGAVKRQLIADVPIGLFLSGGIDSSAIAASAMAVQSRSLSSFSVGFDFDGGVNELPKARRVARHFGLDHHELHISGNDLEQTLIGLARLHDEPFADAANIPLMLLARELKGQVKVVLQGDGGDEVFGGYRRYALLRNAAYWRLFPPGLVALMEALMGRQGMRVGRLFRALSARDPARRMALLLTTETLRDPPSRLLTGDSRRKLEAGTQPFAAYERAARRFSSVDPVQQMLLTDLTTQLPSQFLTKVDRATMAFGLEARVPLLDESVVRLGLTLPSTYKASGTQKKLVFRASQRGRVPDDVLDGPKTGFGVPYEHWLRTSLHDLARDATLDAGFLDRFGFARSALSSAFEEHRSGRREWGFTLWKVFQLALWARHCQPNPS